MTTLPWIFLALFLITTILYIITYIKKISLAQKIILPFTIPFATAFELIELFTRYPDSFHLIVITLISSFFATTAIIIQNFNAKEFFVKTTHFCIFLTIAVWNYLYFPTYFIYRIPQWFSIVFVIIYAIMFITLCVLLGKQKLSYYIGLLILLLASEFLHICSFAALCFGQKLYALVLFIGTTLMLAVVFFYLLSMHRIKVKHSRFIITLGFVLSQIIVALSCLVMIYF